MIEAPELDHNAIERECREFLLEHNIFVKSVNAQIDQDNKDILWIYIITEQPSINATLLDLLRTKYTYNQIRIFAVFDGDYSADITLAIKFNERETA